jgi:predicted RNase H-like nuclease (RuvC/YqgF family)
VSILENQLVEKDKQLDEKDRQISELHQLLAIQSKTTAQLTDQLDAMKQLQELRTRRSWWAKLTGKA